MEIIAGITFADVATVVASVIAAASLIVKAAAIIADITPNTADDEFVVGVKRVLTKVVAIADRLALNPDHTQARRAKPND